MSVILRKTIPTLMMSIVAMWMIVEYFVTEKFFTDIGTIVRNFTVIIAAFAVALGALSSFRYHTQTVIKRKGGAWEYSLVLITALTVMTVTGLTGWLDNPVFSFLWNQVTVPSQQTVYSLLMFYVAAAAYRALRASNLQAAIFMFTAIAIMLMNGPFTQALIPGITELGNWILTIPSTGGSRGYLIASNIGIVALYIRIILGRETGIIGATKE